MRESLRVTAHSAGDNFDLHVRFPRPIYVDPDKLKIVKMDTDKNTGVPIKYGVRGIPTLMLFKNGNVEATKVGALSRTQLAAFIDANI